MILSLGQKVKIINEIGNAQPEALLKIAQHYENNAVFDAIIMRPNIDIATLEFIARNNNTQSLTLMSIIEKTSDSNILKLILKNKNTDVLVRIAIAKKTIDPDILQFIKENNTDNVNIIIAIAQNPSATKEMLDDIACEYGDAVTLAVAQNTNTDSKTLEKILLTNPNDKIVLAIANNHNTDPETLDNIAENYLDDRSIILAVANNFNTSSETLETIINANDYLDNIIIALAVARNPNTSSSVLAEIIDAQIGLYEDKKIILAVAKHLNTNPETLKEIIGAYLNNRQISLAVAKNLNANFKILDGIINKYLDDHEVSLVVAKHLNASPESLRIIAKKYFKKENGDEIIAAIAGNLNTGAKMLEYIAQAYLYYNNGSIILAAAKNPHIKAEILDSVVQECINDADLMLAVAKNPSTQHEALECIINTYRRVNTDLILLAAILNKIEPTELALIEQAANNINYELLPDLCNKLYPDTELTLSQKEMFKLLSDKCFEFKDEIKAWQLPKDPIIVAQKVSENMMDLNSILQVSSVGVSEIQFIQPNELLQEQTPPPRMQ